MIQQFYELTCPERDGASEGRDWTTFHYASAGVYYYLLNDDSNRVIDLMTINDTKDIYFETEVDCHLEASEYYFKYGVPYPYITEWKAAIVRAGTVTLNPPPVPTSTTIQSEEMVF